MQDADHDSLTRECNGKESRDVKVRSWWLDPAAVKEPLSKHLQGTKRQHEEDLKNGLGRVALPNALDRKLMSENGPSFHGRF